MSTAAIFYERRHRWKATVTYRTDEGPLAVEHDLAEIFDLHDLVEQGPHFDTIIDIRVVRAELPEGPLTVEQSTKLRLTAEKAAKLIRKLGI